MSCLVLFLALTNVGGLCAVCVVCVCMWGVIAYRVVVCFVVHFVLVVLFFLFCCCSIALSCCCLLLVFNMC